jgi:hypothetical protein
MNIEAPHQLVSCEHLRVVSQIPALAFVSYSEDQTQSADHIEMITRFDLTS